jgi:hypothetical protein
MSWRDRPEFCQSTRLNNCIRVPSVQISKTLFKDHNYREVLYSTLAIQESTLGRSGKDGEAPSGNLVKSGGEVDITKLLSLLCRCHKALMWLPFSC